MSPSPKSYTVCEGCGLRISGLGLMIEGSGDSFRLPQMCNSLLVS